MLMRYDLVFGDEELIVVPMQRKPVVDLVIEQLISVLKAKPRVAMLRPPPFLEDEVDIAGPGRDGKTCFDVHGEVAVAVSAQRLHAIAGKYTGKDDPVAVVRNQGIFPAPEEITSPFAKAHFVGGDARGSHVMPLMPVPLNTPVTGMYCLPIVSCVGFSIDKEGRFSESYTDFFDNPAWDEVRQRAQRKAIEMRSQGWSGAAMLPYSELEYGGFRDTVSALLKRFRLREERKPEAAE